MHDKIYYYKDKPYRILRQSKIKWNGQWHDVIIYECLYDNMEGDWWVRPEEEFFNLFKPLP